MSRLATDNFNSEVGVRLAAVRAAVGLTQVQFAESIGLTDRAYSNYERGTREVPATVVRSLLDVYNIDPVWLLNGVAVEPEYVIERKVDMQLLAEVIDVVAQELKAAKLTFTAAKHAKFLYFAYCYAADEREVSTRRIRDMIRMVS